MNPAANGTASGSLAAALTIIVNAWLQRLHQIPLSPDETAAYMTVLTAAFSYYFHLRTINPNFRLLRFPWSHRAPAPQS